jgi:hypothetical protein
VKSWELRGKKQFTTDYTESAKGTREVKKEEIINEAISIGNDSYELQHFMQLKKTASKESQIEALKSDRAWQQDHLDEVQGRIDRLIHKLEFE